MKKILIADGNKASLVMTSEVFKDHFPGVQVIVAKTSAEAIELAKTCGEVDAFIIDFDLPDRDGAYTAAKIKKFSNTPILITAFEKPEVQKIIELELAAYDDCLTWLKKPVRPELVVSVAKRFIEGRFRCQRRIECGIPALMEATVVVTSLVTLGGTAVVKKKSTILTSDAKAKKPKTEEKTSELRIFLPVVLEDSSVGGVKIKVAKTPIPALLSKVAPGSSCINWNLKIEETSPLQLILPTLQNIMSGPESLATWQLYHQDANGPAVKVKSTSTLKALKSKSVKNEEVKSPAPDFMSLKGKVAWQDSCEESAVIGLQSDNPQNSKKIFETLIELHQKEMAKKATAADREAEFAALISSQVKSQRSRARPKTST